MKIEIKKITKIILVNFSIFFIAILTFEIFFGYFFKENNFGYIMRSERQKDQIYEVIHNGEKYIYNYKRNYHGFRGKEILPSKIKIVFEGGSTGNQRFTPEELTIVGLLNYKLKKIDGNFEIINASTDGKTTRGYVNDFIYWFKKLENFNPNFIIFYTGINDSNISQYEKYDLPWAEDDYSKFIDYLKNNSKIVELFKKVKFKYFNQEIRKEYEVTKIKEDLYNDFRFVDYQTAIDLHKNYNNVLLVEQFRKRLDLLKKKIEKFKFTPIFITQIYFDGLSEKKLFLINETLKNFCKKNNYPIIKLDEMIYNLELYSFYDEMHTTPKGNRIIAEKIYPKLLEIINKKKGD